MDSNRPVVSVTQSCAAFILSARAAVQRLLDSAPVGYPVALAVGSYLLLCSNSVVDIPFLLKEG